MNHITIIFLSIILAVILSIPDRTDVLLSHVIKREPSSTVAKDTGDLNEEL